NRGMGRGEATQEIENHNRRTRPDPSVQQAVHRNVHPLYARQMSQVFRRAALGSAARPTAVAGRGLAVCGCRKARIGYIADMRWTVETLDPVDDEIAALPVKLRARMIRLLEMVERVGLQELREP